MTSARFKLEINWLSVLGKKRKDPDDIQVLGNQIDQAKKDWINAQKNLNAVTEYKDIDYFVHLIDCTEKRYMYLIKKARICNERGRNR